jgi:drug/metabolite transporter (DMT)-like permease
VIPPEEPRPRDALVHASLIAVQVAFATLSVVGRVVLAELPPMAFASLRLVFAALAFAAFSPSSFGRALPARDKLGIAGCAALGIYGNQVLFLSGLARTTATNATVLVATIPIFAAVAAIALGGERPRPRVLGGIALAFGGIVYLVGVEALELGGAHTIGDLLVTANAAIYALYLVLVRGYVGKHGGLPVVTWGFFCGALFSLPLGVPDLIEAAPRVSATTWGWVAYAILVPTIFTYLTNAWALRWATTSTVAIYIYIQPTIAAVLAWQFLGEEPHARLLVAALLVFAGIWIVTRTPAPVAATEKARAEGP